MFTISMMLKRAVGVVALVLAMAASIPQAALAAPPPAPASMSNITAVQGMLAEAVVEINTFRNAATNRCIDDSDAGFRTMTCNNTSAQKWEVKPWADHTVELKSVLTKRCIDDSDEGFRTITCNKARNQSWYVDRFSSGGIALRNQATGRCIDDSDEGFRTITCYGNNHQRWR